MELNEYSDFIEEQLDHYKSKEMWNTKICNTQHSDIIQDLSIYLFKIETLSIFKPIIDSKKCDCGKKCKQLSYGITEKRSDIIERALQKVYFDITQEITLNEILIAYFEEHKYCDISFKCQSCYLKEKIVKIYTLNDIPYVKHIVPSDGHCFFHAVSLHIDLCIEQLREQVADYMLSYKDDFIDKYVKSSESDEIVEYEHDTYEEFVEIVRTTDDWVDQLVIQATQMVINRPIQIYQDEDDDLRLLFNNSNHNTIDSDSEPILVLFNGTNHYDALIKRNSSKITVSKEWTKENLQQLTVPEIKKLLKNNRLKSSGKKSTLIRTYLKHIKDNR
tara:strand:+ start:597 stop:1592 length:996 start_codon:yes stop_codon:yes gene_type:complete